MQDTHFHMPPANGKPGKTAARKARRRWSDERAPAAWRLLVSARHAGGRARRSGREYHAALTVNGGEGACLPGVDSDE